MIDLLATFVAVAAAANFSKVARSQRVAVSSVARAIDALEADLGTKLFHRSSRRLMLTDAGELFLPRAGAILAELASARDSLANLGTEPRGVLTVTAPAMFGRQHVAPVVIDFLRQYPLLEVELHASDEIVDLTARRVDVAIRIGSLPSSDLVATPLAVVHRVVCASPEYIARRGRPATPTELLEHDCLTVASSPVPPGWWCFAGVNRDAALAVRGSLRSDDTAALLLAAVSGVGIVHLASWAVSDQLASGRLVSLFPEARAPARAPAAAIHAVRLPGRSHTVKAQLFIAHLRKAFGTPPYWDRALRTPRS